jgi:hypothetical protein
MTWPRSSGVSGGFAKIVVARALIAIPTTGVSVSLAMPGFGGTAQPSASPSTDPPEPPAPAPLRRRWLIPGPAEVRMVGG